MAKHSQEFKQKVVEHYLSGNAGYRSTAHLFGIDHSTVRKWTAVFQRQGIDGLAVSSHKTKYSPEFKQQVIDKMRDEGLSLREAVAHFGIRSPGLIWQWLRLYESGGIDGLQPKPKGRVKQMPKQLQSNSVTADLDKTHAELLKELEYLRAENAFLKKLNALIQEQESEQQSPQD